MSKITISYTKPIREDDDRKVLSISSLFEPEGSYVDSDPYSGTVYDTNTYDENQKYTGENLVKYVSTLTNHKGMLLMFKQAEKEGSISFTETDAQTVEYYKELGVALAPCGFSVTVADETSSDPTPGD